MPTASRETRLRKIGVMEEILRAARARSISVQEVANLTRYGADAIAKMYAKLDQGIAFNVHRDERVLWAALREITGRKGDDHPAPEKVPEPPAQGPTKDRMRAALGRKVAPRVAALEIKIAWTEFSDDQLLRIHKEVTDEMERRTA